MKRRVGEPGEDGWTAVYGVYSEEAGCDLILRPGTIPAHFEARVRERRDDDPESPDSLYAPATHFVEVRRRADAR